MQPGVLEAVQVEVNGGEEEQKAKKYKDNQDFVEPLYPDFVGDSCYAECPDQYRRCWGDHVGKSITKLVSHYGCLPRKTDHIRKGSHYRHRYSGFCRGRRNENVQQGLYRIH